MKIIKETETEIYIEVEPKELPLQFASRGKKLHVRWMQPNEKNYKNDFPGSLYCVNWMD